jgi:hypothetical protein
MLSATSLGTGDSVQVTLTANEAAAALLASLNSGGTSGPLTISVRSGDSVELFSALTGFSDETNADQVSSDSLTSVGTATIDLANFSLDNDASVGLTLTFDPVVVRSSSYDDTSSQSSSLSLSGTIHWQHDVQGDVLSSDEPQLLLEIEEPFPEFPRVTSRPASSQPGISAINARTEKAANVGTEVDASVASETSDSAGTSNNTSTGSRTRRTPAETRQAVQLVLERFLLLVSPAVGRAGGSSVAFSEDGTGASTAGEVGLSGLATLLSSLASPAQRETRESPAASEQSFVVGELAPPDGQHATTEFAVDAGTPTVTLAASLPAIALQQTAVSLAGMFEDLLLTLNSLLHAIGVAVGSESSGTQTPVAPTVAPVFPGAADPRQFVAGSQTIQSVLVDDSGNGQLQLEPFSRRENSIQSLALEFAPRHGQLLVRDLRKGMLEFEAVPGFDGADSAVWQATLDDGSSIQGTIVFLVDSSATQAASAQASLFDVESSATSAVGNAIAPQAVPASDRDAAFSSDELLSRLLR